MERCNDEHFNKSSLRDEHYHRYQIAALVAKGRIADCASGIGYGGQIMEKFGKIDSYIGIDPSAEAIEYANKNYKSDKLNYIVGTLEENSVLDKTIDTFLMFETLEHTGNPDRALKGAVTKLAEHGLLMGSVPSREYELLCEEVYDPNPYHLHKFSFDDVTELLSNNFESFKIFAAEFVLGTMFRPLPNQIYDTSTPDKVAGEISLREKKSRVVDGSFFFVAGSNESVSNALNTLGEQYKFLPSIPKVRIDFEEVKPLQLAFQKSEEMVRARDIALKAQTGMIADRDEAINAQANLLEERWALMTAADEAIAAQKRASEMEIKRLIEDHELKIKSMELVIAEKDALIEQKDDLLSKQKNILQLMQLNLKSRKFLIKNLLKSITER